MFSLLKDNDNFTWFSKSGRWSRGETLLKCFAIPPAFVTPEEHTRILEMRTLIAFRDFVRNEPPQSCGVGLVTI